MKGTLSPRMGLHLQEKAKQDFETQNLQMFQHQPIGGLKLKVRKDGKYMNREKICVCPFAFVITLLKNNNNSVQIFISHHPNPQSRGQVIPNTYHPSLSYNFRYRDHPFDNLHQITHFSVRVPNLIFS